MTQTPLQKYVTHPLQGVIAHTLYFLLGFIPVDISSAMGGWLAKTIGPLLSKSNIARTNLRHAFPEKNKAEIEEIVKGVWENLGRVGFEFPHIAKMNVYEQTDRFELVGAHYIDQLRDDDQAGIFFSGHMANWEFCPLSAAQRTPPLPVGLIYREPDNPWMRKLFSMRKPTPECDLIPKGSQGARKALNTLKSGGHLAILMDQKMNDGLAVPFFGRDAMTAPAIAQFALKFNCPVIPVQIERKKGVHFKITFYPPIKIENTGNRKEDMQAFLVKVNQNLEDWIRQNPEQWLWLHRRWPK